MPRIVAGLTIALLTGGVLTAQGGGFIQRGGAAGAAAALEQMIAEREAREREARGEPLNVPPSMPIVHRGTNKLMLFGDENHTEYLGCLNCGELHAESVFNPIGRFGSSVSRTSITNAVSRYGSTVSRHSACSQVASNPPVVVDGLGNYYGELTVNQVRRRINNPQLLGWLAAMCSDH